jgi:response regulator RpfG family c-di-GMP phosphodiesterase
MIDMNSRIKILYVDDEAINLRLFAINFGSKYDVLTAESGQQGLELLDINRDTPVVVSDLRMPGMNGIEFIKKAKEKYPEKRFFILTGFEITEMIQEALETGLIQKYFRKPFNKVEIDYAISEAIEKS